MFGLVTAQIFDGCGGHMDGAWGWLMVAGWFLLIVAVIVIGVVLTRHVAPPGPNDRSAAHVLDERFARGDIDDDEYRRRRGTLRS